MRIKKGKLMFTPDIEKLESKLSEDVIKKANQLIEKDFYEYGDENIHAALDEDKRVIRYNYFLRYNGKPVYIIVTISEDGEIVESYCDSCVTPFEHVRYCPHTLGYIKIIAKRNIDLFAPQNMDSEIVKKVLESFQELEEEKRQKELKATIERNQRVINRVIYQTPSSNINLLKDKISLLPMIIYSRYGSFTNPDYLFTIKVRNSNGKLYIMKDIDAFMRALQSNDVIQYGKSFSFDHSIYNFDQRSQQIIALMKMYWLPGYNNSKINRYFRVNDYFVGEVLRIYQGSYVLYLGEYDDIKYSEPYYVSAEPLKIGLEIDENSHLKLKGEKIDLFIYGGEHCYVTSNHVIYPLEDEYKPSFQVIEALVREPKFTLEGVEDEFVKEIYPKVYEYVEVSESFQKKHPIEKLDIHCYIDYEDGIITVNTRCVANENVYSIENVPDNEFYQNKIQRYKDVLEKLGFVQNRIDQMDQIGKFFQTDLTYLKEIADVYLSESIKNTKVKTLQKSKVNIGFQTDMMSVFFSMSGFSEEELYKVISDFRKHKKYTKLKNDTIIAIDEKAAKEIDDAIKNLGLDEKNLFKEQLKPLYTVFQTTASNPEWIEYKLDTQMRQLISKIKNYKNADYSIPPSLKPYLRSYQVEAFQWLKTLVSFKFSGILADDMGLGKTIEMISVLMSDENELPSLIVSPKSLVYNWKEEFKKWGATVPVEIVVGSAHERKSKIKAIEPNVKKIFVTSYDSLKNDIEFYKDKKFRFTILDEAQFIKNHQTLKAKSVKQIESQIRFALTGTPIENTVLDLWSIFDFLLPNYLYNYSNFHQQFERSILLHKNQEMVDLLVKKITPFVLRRSKNEVLKDLPPKIETITYVTMEEDQRKIYDAFVLKVRDQIETVRSKIDILASLTRLRQICVDPKLFLENYEGSSIKTQRCMEIVQEAIATEHKVIIFSQFVMALAGLEQALIQASVPYFILTGSTSAEERVSMAEEFNRYDEKKVFLVSLKAGGTGLNLVGADIVIHLDPWWNVSVENQATDRAHRIGQKRSVQVIKLIAEETIEQKVLELQNLKKDLADQIISEGDHNLQKLTESDLKYLLS